MINKIFLTHIWKTLYYFRPLLKYVFTVELANSGLIQEYRNKSVKLNETQ
jgi:hypothetical protein